jgi:hypothetical protein
MTKLGNFNFDDTSGILSKGISTKISITPVTATGVTENRVLTIKDSSGAKVKELNLKLTAKKKASTLVLVPLFNHIYYTDPVTFSILPYFAVIDTETNKIYPAYNLVSSDKILSVDVDGEAGNVVLNSEGTITMANHSTSARKLNISIQSGNEILTSSTTIQYLSNSDNNSTYIYTENYFLGLRIKVSDTAYANLQELGLSTKILCVGNGNGPIGIRDMSQYGGGWSDENHTVFLPCHPGVVINDLTTRDGISSSDMMAAFITGVYANAYKLDTLTIGGLDVLNDKLRCTMSLGTSQITPSSTSQTFAHTAMKDNNTALNDLTLDTVGD